MNVEYSKEIWHMACPEISQSFVLNLDLLQLVQYIIIDSARERHGSLPLFLGWRIWNMENAEQITIRKH